ncbi:MAG: hypothetical protein WCJ02_02665 [bacterium]
MGKVAIVGVEGSGKTVLMAGLCECFKQVPGTDDPYLMPENQAAFKFMETVPYMLRVKRQWPAATSIDNLRAMRWTYRCGDEVLETVELLDYPGELYRLAFGDAEEVRKEELESKRDEVKKFLDHLIDADTLLVLLNLSDVINLGENHKNLETVWITRGILTYAKKLPNIKHTVLVFTQADRYAEELQTAGGPDALYAQKLPMLKTLFPEQQVIAIAAISKMDSEGRPNDNYSSEACRTIMKVMLADYLTQAKKCLVACEEKLKEIESFKTGNVGDYSNLVCAYGKAIEEFQKALRCMPSLYSATEHTENLKLCSEFWDACNKLITEKKERELAAPETWNDIIHKFNGTENYVLAFRTFYRKSHAEAEYAFWFFLGLLLLVAFLVILAQ